MAQPLTQELLAAGHSSEYFFYAQGTGLWDARNGASLAKTGTAPLATEGGVQVALADKITSYALASDVTLVPPYTARVRARATAGAHYNGMVMGDRTATNSFVWFKSLSYYHVSSRINVGASYGVIQDIASIDNTSLTTYTITIDALRNCKLYKGDTVVYSGNAAGTDAISFVVNTLMWGYIGGAATYGLEGAFEFAHLIPGVALSGAQVASYNADPYQVLAVNGMSGNATLDGLTASGSMSSEIPSSLSGGATLADILAGGSLGVAPAVITSPAFKNWSGTLLTGLTVPKVAILKVSDMSTVLTLTNQTTNGSGVLSITNAALVAGTPYLLVTCDAGGVAFGCEPVTAV